MSHKDAIMLDIRSTYTMSRPLGTGTFCKVVLGTHKVTGGKVAIKIFNLSKLKKMGVLKKVKTELDIVGLLTPHPNIVKIYQVVCSPTHIYAVLEYLSNGDLFDYIVTKGKLGEAEARSMFQELISGIDYCHSMNVVHRDLKPENILLDAHGHVKLADFGLSNLTRDGFFLSTSCGSPNYAAPEVISAEQYGGPEVDVWSCGVILYAMLCGRLPFDADNIHTLYASIKKGVYTIPHFVSAGPRDLIGRMLVVDPLRRINVHAIKQHEWYAVDAPAFIRLSPYQQATVARAINVNAVREVAERLDLPVETVHTLVSMHLHRGDPPPSAVRGAPGDTSDPTSLLRPLVTPIAANELIRGQRSSTPGKGPLDTISEVAVLYHLVVDHSASAHGPSWTALPTPLAIDKSERDEELRKRLAIPHQLSSSAFVTGAVFEATPALVMTALYRTLARLGFEWKCLSTYRVKARRPAIEALKAAISDRAQQGEVPSKSFPVRRDFLKIIVSLYKLPKSKKDKKKKREKERCSITGLAPSVPGSPTAQHRSRASAVLASPTPTLDMVNQQNVQKLEDLVFDRQRRGSVAERAPLRDHPSADGDLNEADGEHGEGDRKRRVVSFALDIQKLVGPPFLFLEVASELLGLIAEA